MKKYEREKYTLKEYDKELYRLDIFDEESKTENSEFNINWEYLYKKAKDETEKGKTCSIWELKYEFIS